MTPYRFHEMQMIYVPGEFLMQDYDIKPLHLFLHSPSERKSTMHAIILVTFNLGVKGIHIYSLYGTCPTAQTVTMAIGNFYLVIFFSLEPEKNSSIKGDETML